MHRTYTLLLNDTMRAHLVSLGRRARQRLREKLDLLKEGMWDGGMRVKKLKGSGRRVFEARLSRGDRILFTLGQPAADNPDTSDRLTRIYVWGVERHDDVSAAARRIVPANAPFLDFQPDAVEELPDEGFVDDLDQAWFSPALDRPAHTPDPAAPPDAGPQRWLVVDDEEWRRLQTAHASDHLELYLFLTREQARLLHSEPPLLLSGTAGSGKTTIAVYYLLRHRVRQLTVAAGAPAPAPEPPPGGERALFLTYSPHLKRLSERIYRGLVRATDLERAPHAVRFATFGELLAEILGQRGGERWQAAPAGLAEFHSIYGNLPRAARHDPELVWEEIRAIIKGAKPPVSRRRFAELAARFQAAAATQRERGELAEYVVRLANLELGDKLDAVRERRTSFATLAKFAAGLRDGDAARGEEQRFLLDAALRLLDKQSARLAQPLLTLREYQGLGAKRAPNFPVDRSDVYRIAEYYQQQLAAAARYDEIDLTRAALEYLEQHGEQFRYDLVVCDEVQDFTDVQLALLFRLAVDPRRTVLTGDPKQIINPSGFRWEEVRARYYERGLPVPEVINLSINFRSVGNIVSLANKLLELKGSLIGLGSGEIAERWTFRGRPPLLIEDLPESELLRTVRLGGAGQVVLARTERERDRLRAALQTELVFTIGEAKGLEFDAVLLWRFSATEGAPAIWRRIASDRVRGDADTPHIRHELNLLYVAVTRARNSLVIWDGEQVSPIWGIETLADQVYRSADATAFETIWQRVSTPAEWEAQGDYFAEREHYAAAEECYRHAQAVDKEDLARARRLQQEGDHRAAAALFLRHGRAVPAAENLERAAAFREAARAWRRAGNEQHATASEARHYESVGNYAAAARRWEQLGVDEGILRNWERGREFGKLAQYHLGRKAGAEAAHYLKLAGDHAAAAVQFRRAGLLELAAQEFEQAGDHQRAATLYRRLKDGGELLRCLLHGGAYHDAGEEYEKRGDLEKAAECFRRYAESSSEARQDLERRLARITPKRPGMRAAVRLVALGRLGEAAPIYARRGHQERAAELFSAAGRHDNAALCLAQCGRYREAAREAVRGGDAQGVRMATSYLADYLTSDRSAALIRIGELNRTAGRLVRNSDYEHALAHYLAIDEVSGHLYLHEVTTIYAKLGRHADAIGYALDRGESDPANAYLNARPDLVLPLAAAESLARGSEHRQPLSQELRAGVVGVLLRLLHGCLFRGAEPDRRARIAALLEALPSGFAYTSRLSSELSDLMIDLRLYHLLEATAKLHRYREEGTAELRYFQERLERTAMEERDRELALCLLLDRPDAYEAAIAEIAPTARNVPLFAESSTRYAEAVAILLESGATRDAAEICRRHRDHARCGRIYEESGDQQRAGRAYRDGGLYADAHRCFAACGDEAGTARVYERELRFEQALAIWQRLGRKREVERLRKKMGHNLAR